jgi:hypothetical protein
MNQTFSDITKIRLGTALISLLLSVFLIYNDAIINADGILYMNMAEAFLQGGLIETAKLWNWPFFSIIVAYLHQITSLPLETSAYVINTLLAVLLTDTLLLISHKLLPNMRQLTIAALFIVSFYTLNEYRDFVIRDMGYWAFCSLSLYRFMLYLESNSIKNASLWQLFALTAILFRIEGVFVLVTLPLYLFFIDKPILALKKLLHLNYLLIIGGIVIPIMAISYSDVIADNSFSKIFTISQYIDIQKTIAQIGSRADLLEMQVLDPRTAQYGILILVSGLFSMLIFKVVKAISFGYLAIFVSSFWYKSSVNTNNKYLNLLGYFTLIHLTILAVFLFTQYFFSTRYAMMAILTLLLLMLPKITSWVDEAWQSKHKVRVGFIGLILFISIGDILTSSISKAYIKNAAIWAGSNIPKKSSILTSNAFAHYYLKNNSHDHDIKLAKHGKNKGYDYLAKKYQNYEYLVTIEKIKDTKLPLTLQKMNIELIHCEQNKRDDRSCVYKVIQNE